MLFAINISNYESRCTVIQAACVKITRAYTVLRNEVEICIMSECFQGVDVSLTKVNVCMKQPPCFRNGIKERVLVQQSSRPGSSAFLKTKLVL
jgi:hypothetical protein